jgi:uncharacterized integral membrane protein
MNTKLIFKTAFLMVILFLLVLMGMGNRETVKFSLPWIMQQAFPLPAAVMYFAFFAVGFLTGTILTAGGKQGGGSKSPKNDK